ncbi:MAG: phosphoribosyl-ATP pyrophosphohydrolase [Phenylobacterium sp.]|uniref:phosphoribosyl-ATP pyrophosphohydrolase n=1 Tax=Phenylobacterium sp. TaxID=1871053 RepID=UPI0025D236EE|nr:phosphoribosyl-ATP pyrophosphohydrolase [Phenylobacterium sp.]MBI1199328.1 phosphoribosyl-ATP pyrophosphohydrolase [Phenylobacterium sp.]
MPERPLTFSEATDSAERVSDIYARNFNIARDDDWYLLKLQEELGELAQAHLRLSRRGRGEATEHDRADEAADLLCMLLLYARRFDIDLDAAVRRKWLTWLEPVA